MCLVASIYHLISNARSYLTVKYIVLITDDKKELEETKKRYNELSQKLTEKNRQYLKLQVGIMPMDKLTF